MCPKLLVASALPVGVKGALDREIPDGGKESPQEDKPEKGRPHNGAAELASAESSLKERETFLLVANSLFIVFPTTSSSSSSDSPSLVPSFSVHSEKI